jgi:hypothetical protein
MAAHELRRACADRKPFGAGGDEPGSRHFNVATAMNPLQYQTSPGCARRRARAVADGSAHCRRIQCRVRKPEPVQPRVRPPTGACRPRGTPSTSRNTLRRRCLRGAKAPRYSPRRAAPPARCESSLPPSIAGVSDAECPSTLVLPALSPARISAHLRSLRLR